MEHLPRVGHGDTAVNKTDVAPGAWTLSHSGLMLKALTGHAFSLGGPPPQGAGGEG